MNRLYVSCVLSLGCRELLQISISRFLLPNKGLLKKNWIINTEFILSCKHVMLTYNKTRQNPSANSLIVVTNAMVASLKGQT